MASFVVVLNVRETVSPGCEALAMDGKGERGWGYGHACLNTQVRRAGVGGG